MKKTSFQLLTLYCLLSFSSSLMAQIISTGVPDGLAPKKNSETIRIMTYNIRACRGLNDSFDLNPNLSGNVISVLNPDIAAIQEVDRNNKRSHGTDQIYLLGEMVGLHSYYGKAIDFAEGEYGVGALTSEEAISVRTVPLPGKEEPRVLLEVELSDIVLFNTHLSLTYSSRVESAAIINNEISRYDKPIVLTGDFNVSDDTEIDQLFGKHWTVLSPFEETFPADEPKIRLDFIMIADPTNMIHVNSPIFQESVLKSFVVPTIASDHRPVYIDLDIGHIKSAL
ncbi:MAG: hypothetical protein IKE69_13100 [Thermoguttaceae bacterium]|nr:hypothetical protein [Thermoguttaceae bacterium]